MNQVPAGNVETSRSNGIVAAALQILSVMHLLEQLFCSVDDRGGQVDSVSHVRYFSESVGQGSVGTSHLETYIN